MVIIDEIKAAVVKSETFDLIQSIFVLNISTHTMHDIHRVVISYISLNIRVPSLAL